MCNGGGGGVGSGCVESIYRSYTLAHLTRFRTTPTKSLGGEGATDRWTPAAKSIYRSIFKKLRPLGFDVFIVIWSMVAYMATYPWVTRFNLTNTQLRHHPPPLPRTSCFHQLIVQCTVHSQKSKYRFGGYSSPWYLRYPLSKFSSLTCREKTKFYGRFSNDLDIILLRWSVTKLLARLPALPDRLRVRITAQHPWGTRLIVNSQRIL